MKKILGFFIRQFKHVKKGGFSVFFKKSHLLYSKIEQIALTIVAIPIVLILRMLRPFLVIRLAMIDSGRIGHLQVADWYLCQSETNSNNNRHLDIFYFISSIGKHSNNQWLKMWKRVLLVFPWGRLAWAVEELNNRIPGGKPNSNPLQNNLFEIPGRKPPRNSIQSHVYDRHHTLKSILECKQPNLTFTTEEEYFGENALQNLAIPPGKPFICFNTRDAAYLNTKMTGWDWSYHDYRNADIDNYIAAAEELVRRGYYAIRVGFVVEKKLTVSNPAIIDYATNGKRTEFLDIYLAAKCRFFICPEGGISVPPEIFRRPCVYVNWVPITRISPWVHCGLFIPKKFFLRHENRFLTFDEIINSEIGNVSDGKIFTEQGIELIENTPEEIVSVVIEMDERLNGTWQVADEDEELQKCFWALFSSNLLKSPDLRIGAEFLSQNQKLLG